MKSEAIIPVRLHGSTIGNNFRRESSPTDIQGARAMRNSRIEVYPIAGACGAEIAGVKIGDAIDDSTIAEIRQALNEHGVVFFRDQQFDAEQHKKFARRFGDIFVHPNYRGMQEDD